MQRPTQRPRLDEPPVPPERVAHILLRDAVDARGQLQLGRGLHLRVHTADSPHDVDQLIRRCTLRQRTARESPRANLVPGQRNRF
jgi:hypothetical protein